MAEVKSKALINRDSVNKTLFKKFLEPRTITGNNAERSVRAKKDLKEFVALFKKTYGRAPSPLEINNIAKIDRAAVAKYLTKGTDYLSPEETRKITNAEPSLRKTKLDTELSKPVDKLTYTSIDNKKTIIPRFTSKTEEAEYKKLIKEKYSKVKGQSKIDTEYLAKKFLKTDNPTKTQLNNIRTINGAIAKELKLKYPTQTYEGQAAVDKKNRETRTKNINEVSSRSKESKIRDLKKGSPLDLAHRSSLTQNKNLGLKYLVSDLGFDPSIINQEIIIPAEQKLESLYKKQKFLVDKAQKFHLDKNKKIPLTLQKALEDINKKITDVAYSTDGRLNGIVVDEKTLKPGKVGIDYFKIPGIGLLEDKPVKDITTADMDLIKLNAGNQIENETQIAKNLTQIYESGTKKLRDKFDKRIGCKTGCFVKKLNEDPQKMIRLFRGEPLKSRTAESVKALAKKFNISEAEAGKRILEGQWYTPTPEMAGRYTDKLGKMKYVDVTPAEYLAMNKYTQRINKTNDLSGKLRYPVSEREAISIVPRRKLKQFEETGRMKSKRTIFGDVDTPMGTLKYDSVVGGFIDPADPTKLVDQAQIKTWAQDNPMPVRVGEEPLKVATNKSVLKNVGRTMARIGAPLPTAVLDSYFIGQQVKEGKGTAEIASDPLNWIGLAAMEPLSKVSGIAESGKLNSALRLGLNPATIRGISRFAGLPGLAVSTAMTAYDQYKKYQNEEGFIYNLFNKEGK